MRRFPPCSASGEVDYRQHRKIGANSRVQQEPKELLKLVGDLYRLSKDTRVFIESRFLGQH